MALKGVKKLSTSQECYMSSEDSQDSVDDDNSLTDGILNEENVETDDIQNTGGGGWADAIAKVLNTTKPKNKKNIVLSRAKKYIADNVKEKKQDYGFEIDGVSEEKPNVEELQEHVEREVRNHKLDLRVKPSWHDIERERALRKIATKGVVQLFNAVRMQQKDLQQKLQEAGPIHSRKEAAMNNINKKKFLDVLMGGKRAKSEAIDNPIKTEIKKGNEDSSEEEEDDNNKKRGWGVLRHDFMTNKKSKHWDQNDDSDSDVDASIPSDDTNDNFIDD